MLTDWCDNWWGFCFVRPATAWMVCGADCQTMKLHSVHLNIAIPSLRFQLLDGSQRRASFSRSLAHAISMKFYQ
jgi:hypothetical protein